jgi:HSP20 family protein
LRSRRRGAAKDTTAKGEQIMARIPWKSKERARLRPECSRRASLRRELERLTDTYLREPLETWEWPFSGQEKWTPPVDVSHDHREVVVRAELPGVDPRELEITLSGDELVLSGQKAVPADESGKDFVQSEIAFGSFRRAVRLPDRIDPEAVEACYADGVLSLRLVKQRPAPARRIDVRSGDAGAAPADQPGEPPAQAPETGPPG